MTLFIGIDPGLHGAIAVHDDENQDWQVIDMPTHTLTVNGKKRQKLDMHQLREALSVGLLESKPIRAFIEDVHFVPIKKKDGTFANVGVSAFSFGFVAGAIQQAVVDAGMELNLVPPQVWKRRYGLTADKDAARAKASMLLPGHAHLWPLKKHDGRAEAALIALYGARYG